MVPKIGRSVATEKSDIRKIADDLAAKTRILHRAADEHAAVVDMLRAIGEEEVVAADQRRRVELDADVARLAPLLEQARVILADADAARAEDSCFLTAFDGLEWEAVKTRFTGDHGTSPNSMESTRTRVDALRTAVEELRQHLKANDGDMRVYIQVAAKLVEKEDGALDPDARSRSIRYAADNLRQVIALRRDGGAAIRTQIGGIRRRLDAIGDVLPGDAPAEEAK